MSLFKTLNLIKKELRGFSINDRSFNTLSTNSAQPWSQLGWKYGFWMGFQKCLELCNIQQVSEKEIKLQGNCKWNI